jgi:hypothetical protein
VVGSWEHGNESLDLGGGFIDWLSNKDSAPWS